MQQEQSPSYDDGASLLMRDPNMMRVGLFGRRPTVPMEPPVNLARRGIILGRAAPENLPAVRPADIPLPSSSPLPAPLSTPGAMQPGPASPPVQQPTPPHTPTPLEALAQKAINAPMSRRDVLQRAGQAAVNQMLPTPKITDVVPEVALPFSPLVQAAKTIEPGFKPNPLFDSRIADYAQGIIDYTFEQEPSGVAQTLWLASRNLLKDKLPAQEVAKLDQLAKTPGGKYVPDSSDEISDRHAEMLYDKMSGHIRTLAPHEQLDITDHLQQSGVDPAEIAKEISGKGNSAELEKYISDMYDAASPSKE
jgi:hypothetical protein